MSDIRVVNVFAVSGCGGYMCMYTVFIFIEGEGERGMAGACSNLL